MREWFHIQFYATDTVLVCRRFEIRLYLQNALALKENQKTIHAFTQINSDNSSISVG